MNFIVPSIVRHLSRSISWHHYRRHFSSRAFWNKYKGDTLITGRTLDRPHSYNDFLYVNPCGIEMDGGNIVDYHKDAIPTNWVSQYGSVVQSFFGIEESKKHEFGFGFGKDYVIDGMNERGLAVHKINLTSYTEY